MASRLKPTILDALVSITGSEKKAISEKISRMKAKSPILTSNAAAYLIAREKGKSLTAKLDDEDKESLRDYHGLIRPSQTIVVNTTQRGKSNVGRAQKKPLINYDSKNYFVTEHIRELTSAYYAGCYTAVFILFRKIIENLIIDILKYKFPSEHDLVYSQNLHRYHDFSIILDNLISKKSSFTTDGKKAIERLKQLAVTFKKDANDKTHSWFHIVKSPSEVDNSELDPIIQLIIFLEIEVGIRKP